MSGLINFVILFILFISTVQAQKILKVRGNKVVISIKSISVNEDDILDVSSDGFAAGKIKIISVGGKTAIGKIIEGSALVGDVVGGGSGESNGSKSSSSDFSNSESSSSSDDDFNPAGKSRGSKSKGSSRKSGGGEWAIYAGLAFVMNGPISSEQGDYAQDALSGPQFKGEYKRGKSSYHFGLQLISGGATFQQKSSSIRITNIDISATNLFFHKATFISKSFYWKMGGEFSMLTVDDTITITSTNPTITGKHSLDLKGLGGVGGIGYNLNFGNWVSQAEFLAQVDYYFSNSSTLPSSISQNFEVGSFLTYGIQIGLNLGYKF